MIVTIWINTGGGTLIPKKYETDVESPGDVRAACVAIGQLGFFVKKEGRQEEFFPPSSIASILIPKEMRELEDLQAELQTEVLHLKPTPEQAAIAAEEGLAGHSRKVSLSGTEEEAASDLEEFNENIIEECLDESEE